VGGRESYVMLFCIYFVYFLEYGIYKIVKIETAEMKLLRSFAGYTRKDHVRNEYL
jgi:hypothetical protein